MRILINWQHCSSVTKKIIAKAYIQYRKMTGKSIYSSRSHLKRTNRWKFCNLILIIQIFPFIEIKLKWWVQEPHKSIFQFLAFSFAAGKPNNLDNNVKHVMELWKRSLILFINLLPNVLNLKVIYENMKDCLMDFSGSCSDQFNRAGFWF